MITTARRNVNRTPNLFILDITAAHWQQLRPEAQLTQFTRNRIGYQFGVMRVDNLLVSLDQFSTLDQVKRNIELINQAGDLCVKQGVLFGYHNHDWELKAVEGVVPLDLMIEQSEPGKVGFQLDAYWIVKGGGSLDDYLSRFAGRFPSCHMKDIDADGNFADVGHGEIDFQAFTAAAMAQGATHFFVERDNPPDPASSILRSYNYLSQMTF